MANLKSAKKLPDHIIDADKRIGQLENETPPTAEEILTRRLDAMETELKRYRDKEALETEEADTKALAVEGRELIIQKVANSALYRVAYRGGGVLPTILDAKWTSPLLAQKAIDLYIYDKK